MKILWVSDCPANGFNTGYATATRLIAVELMKRGHKFVFGSQGSQEANVLKIQVGPYECKSYGFGKGAFLQAAAIMDIDTLEQPDLIVTMADWQMVEQMMGVSNHPAFQKWICYAPIDGDMYSTAWDTMIHEIPYLVYMSPLYGPSVCQRRRFGLVDYVPLPVDIQSHVLMNKHERDEFRLPTKVNSGWAPDTTTVLTVARNQWRKNYPEIIKAAQILKKKMPRKFSFAFHCKPAEPLGWYLPQLIHYHDVNDCVAISDSELDAENKCRLYNSADVFLLPSLGEGFGIPIVEAALYDLPILTTGDTASADLMRLLGGSKQLLQYEEHWQNGPTIPRPFVSGQTIANALMKLDRYGPDYDVVAARKKAELLFNVEDVCRKWEQIFHQAKAMNLVRRSAAAMTSLIDGRMTV